MKKLEYRCNRCLIIEERWAFNTNEQFNSVPCHICGGLALKIPWSKSKDRIFEDFDKYRDNFH